MYRYEYSTITQNSVLQAIGPFRFTSTNPAADNDWRRTYQMQDDSLRITWSKGTLSPFIDTYKTQHRVEKPNSHFFDYEELSDTAYATMLASEAVLGKDWDSPEEDEAWADL